MHNTSITSNLMLFSPQKKLAIANNNDMIVTLNTPHPLYS